MKRRGLLGAGLAAVLAATVTVGWLAAGGTAAKQIVIGYTAPTSLPFDKELQKAMAVQAKALGVKLIVTGGKFDNNAQIAAFNSLIDRHVNGIIAFPIDPNSQLPVIDRANAAKIKVISLDTPGVQHVLTNILTPDLDAAKALAQLGAKAVGGGANCRVGIIKGLPVVPVLNIRNIGYEAGAKAAGCTILDEQISQDDQPATSTAIANTWKTKYGSQMTLMLVYNDPSAYGAEAAVGGSFNPKVIGMNGDEANIQAIKAGRQFADGYVDFEAVGNAAVYAVVQAVKGKKLPPILIAPIKIFTKANLAQYVPYGQREKAPLKVSFVPHKGTYILVTKR
jgi:ribose transport system substrate-binding protein